MANKTSSEDNHKTLIKYFASQYSIDDYTVYMVTAAYNVQFNNVQCMLMYVAMYEQPVKSQSRDRDDDDTKTTTTTMTTTTVLKCWKTTLLRRY